MRRSHLWLGLLACVAWQCKPKTDAAPRDAGVEATPTSAVSASGQSVTRHEAPAAAPAEDAPACASGSALKWSPVPGHPKLQRASVAPRGDAWASRLAFSPGGRWILTVHGQLQIWDARCGGRRDLLKAESVTGFGDAAVSPDGSRLALTDGDRFVLRAFDAGKLGVEIASVRLAGAGLARLVFSPGASRIVIVDRAQLRLFDARAGVLLRTEPTAAPYADLAFSPDGAFIAAVRDGAIDLLDADTLTKVAGVAGPPHASHAAFMRDGSKVLVRGTAATKLPVHTYRVPDLVHLPQVLEGGDGTDGWSDAFDLTRDDAYAASLVIRHLLVWKLPDARPVEDIATVEDDEVQAFAFSPRDAHLFAATVQGYYQVRSARGPELYLWRLE